MDSNNLEFFPGLGSGYLYQRRWVPYFVTGGVATAWIVFGVLLNGETEPTKTEQIIGIGGLFLISITTMIEAKIAHKKAIAAIEKIHQTKPQKKQRGLFR